MGGKREINYLGQTKTTTKQWKLAVSELSSGGSCVNLNDCGKTTDGVVEFTKIVSVQWCRRHPNVHDDNEESNGLALPRKLCAGN